MIAPSIKAYGLLCKLYNQSQKYYNKQAYNNIDFCAVTT